MLAEKYILLLETLGEAYLTEAKPTRKSPRPEEIDRD
jgi:hypothetical protein